MDKWEINVTFFSVENGPVVRKAPSRQASSVPCTGNLMDSNDHAFPDKMILQSQYPYSYEIRLLQVGTHEGSHTSTYTYVLSQ